MIRLSRAFLFVIRFFDRHADQIGQKRQLGLIGHTPQTIEHGGNMFSGLLA